jgi:hypothetical protein
MNIEKEITQIETLIEQYKEMNNPEDRMDLKQTAIKHIQNLRNNFSNLSLNNEELESMNELLAYFEEILSY